MKDKDPAEVLHLSQYTFSRSGDLFAIDAALSLNLFLSNSELGALAAWLNDHAESGDE